jgi:ceramide glucosyltransferase
MEGPLLALLTVLGWLLVAALYVSQRRLLGGGRVPLPGDPPPVSILKPLKGADPDLEANLDSFFRLDYPAYELLFGIEYRSDPALAVARRVASRHPGIRATFVVSSHQVGLNPKVNNLANIAAHARHELLLISDSNVSAPPDHLRVMVGELLRPNVGLVTAPIRALDGRGLGGLLERCQLNTFVVGGVAAVTLLLGGVCAVGKSMLLRRRDLDRIGGWRELARYLAEDQVSGEAIRDLGLRVAVAPRPVDHHLGSVTVRQFAGRHLRWARLRRHLAPLGYAAEILTNPLVPASLHVAVEPNWLSAALAMTTLGVLTAWTMASERLLGVRTNRSLLPLAVVARALAVAALWPVPFLSSTVEWRGRRLRIGRRTLLMDAGDDWLLPDELPAEEPVASRV